MQGSRVWFWEWATRGAQGRTGIDRASWTLALTSVGFFMVALDSLVVVTALPAIHHDIGGGVSTLAWIPNAYLLAFASGIIPAAALGDRNGRRRTYVAGLVLFTVASAACALAPSPLALIAARAVQGLGAAVIAPLSLTILTAYFPAERRASVIGMWGGIAALAVVSGPIIGGAVTQGLNWHWIFWLNVPIGVVAALMVSVRLAESRGQAVRLDLAGGLLVASASFAIVYGLVRGNDSGWTSIEILGAFAIGLALLAFFIYWEMTTAEPMLAMHLFRTSSFSGALSAGFLMNAGQWGAVFLIAQYFQLGLGYSPLDAGTRFLPWTVAILLVSPIGGRLADRFGTRLMITVGLGLVGSAFLWISIESTPGATYAGFVLPLIAAGAGFACSLPAVSAATLSAVPSRFIGQASGTLNSLQRLGAAFGVAAGAAMFASYGRFGSLASMSAGFRPGLALAGAFSIAAAGVAALTVKASISTASDESVTAAGAPLQPERRALHLVRALGPSGAPRQSDSKETPGE